MIAHVRSGAGVPPEVSWRAWVWVLLRALMPWAIGTLGGVLWLAPEDNTFWVMVAVMGQCALWFLALILLRRTATTGEAVLPAPWVRRQWATLSVALLGAWAFLACRWAGADPTWTLGVGVVGMMGGLGALGITSLGDWRRERNARPLQAVVALPWLAVTEYGLLGSWFVLQARSGALLTTVQQTVLACATIVVAVRLLILHRWRGGLPLGNGNSLVWQHLQRDLADLLDLHTWVGCIVPAVLLILAMVNVSALAVFLAWGLLVLGNGTWYYVLLILLRRQPQREHAA